METKILFIVFGVIVQFCDVLGRHNFYEYYYTRHHKGHSTTTETVFPTTLDNLASSEQESFSLDYISWQKTNDMISTPDQNSQLNKNEVTDNIPLQNNIDEPIGRWDDGKWGDDNTDYTYVERDYMRQVWVIIGSLSVVAIIVISICFCIFCCLRQAGRRKERRGFVIGSPPDAAREVVPRQSDLIHQPPELPQAYPTQCDDERSQLFPPQYQPGPMQQYPPMQQFSPTQQFPPMQPQFQYSPPPMHSHNPPEAPPPYEFPEKF